MAPSAQPVEAMYRRQPRDRSDSLQAEARGIVRAGDEMTDIGFEPDRVQRWLATPIGAKVADDNPALQRAADVMLEAMSATGADPLMKLNLLVKGLALTVGTWGLGNTGDPPDDRELQDLCENLGRITWLEAADFLKKLRRDMRVKRHA